MKNSVEKIRFQIRSVIIVKYFELYKVLEKETKDIFSEEIKNVAAGLCDAVICTEAPNPYLAVPK